MTSLRPGTRVGFVYDDGGNPRGGKGVGNCVTRAVAIAEQRSYADVLADFAALHPERNVEVKGVSTDRLARYLGRRGWVWVLCARVHQPAVAIDDLPIPGRLLVLVCGHLFAVIDGNVHDLGDPRDGDGLGTTGSALPVYGYYYHRPTERARASAYAGGTVIPC